MGLGFSRHLGDPIVDNPVDHLFNNRVFIVEITVDLANAQLRFGGNLRHAGSVKTAVAKAAAGSGDDLVLAGFLPGFQLAGHACFREGL